MDMMTAQDRKKVLEMDQEIYDDNKRAHHTKAKAYLIIACSVATAVAVAFQLGADAPSAAKLCVCCCCCQLTMIVIASVWLRTSPFAIARLLTLLLP